MRHAKIVSTYLLALLISFSLTLPVAGQDSGAPSIDEEEFRDLYGLRAKTIFDHPADIRLAKAIEANDLDAIRVAVADGANLNASGFSGIHPLFYAALFQRYERFELLLRLGADPNLPITYESHMPDASKFGIYPTKWTATSFAAGTHFEGYLPMVLKHGGDVRILSVLDMTIPVQITWNRAFCSIDWLRQYVEAGGDINLREPMSCDTVLSTFICRGRYAAADTVIGLGANPDIPEFAGTRDPPWILPVERAVLPPGEDLLQRVQQLRLELKLLTGSLQSLGYDLKKTRSRVHQQQKLWAEKVRLTSVSKRTPSARNPQVIVDLLEGVEPYPKNGILEMEATYAERSGPRPGANIDFTGKLPGPEDDVIRPIRPTIRGRVPTLLWAAARAVLQRSADASVGPRNRR